MMRRVVVTGLGAVTPLGVGARRTWDRLLAGECGIQSVADREPKERWQELTSTVAGIVPLGGIEKGGWDANDWLSAAEQRRTSRFTQYAMAASEMALKDAGWEATREADKEDTGVCLGSGIGNLDDIYSTSLDHHKGVSIRRRCHQRAQADKDQGLQEGIAAICAQNSHKHGSRPHCHEVWLPRPQPCCHYGLHHRRTLNRRRIAIHRAW